MGSGCPITAGMHTIDTEARVALGSGARLVCRCLSRGPDSRAEAGLAADRGGRAHAAGLADRHRQDPGRVPGDPCTATSSRRMATSSWDGTVKLWDATSGQCLLTLTGHTNLVRAVGWSPDGRIVASAGLDGTVRLWDTDSGKQLSVLRGHGDDVQGVCWSPDGARLASASFDQTVRLWDATARKEQLVLKGHTGGVYWASWTPTARGSPVLATKATSWSGTPRPAAGSPV